SRSRLGGLPRGAGLVSQGRRAALSQGPAAPAIRAAGGGGAGVPAPAGERRGLPLQERGLGAAGLQGTAQPGPGLPGTWGLGPGRGAVAAGGRGDAALPARLARAGGGADPHGESEGSPGPGGETGGRLPAAWGGA